LGGGGLGAGGLGAGGTSALGGSLAPSTTLGPAIAIGGTGTVASTVGGTTIPSSSNPLRNYYNNLYQPGSLPPGSTTTLGSFSASSQGGFGQPLYGSPTATATVGIGALQGTQGGGAGFSSVGLPKAPPYVTTLSDDFARPQRSPERLRTDLQSLLQRSSALRGSGDIQLVVNDSRVILRGRVRTPRDRRLAEALIRMTPGVQDVQNNLQVTSPAQPRRLSGF
jgi:hypothetical protein